MAASAKPRKPCPAGLGRPHVEMQRPSAFLLARLLVVVGGGGVALAVVVVGATGRVVVWITIPPHAGAKCPALALPDAHSERHACRRRRRARIRATASRAAKRGRTRARPRDAGELCAFCSTLREGEATPRAPAAAAVAVASNTRLR